MALINQSQQQYYEGPDNQWNSGDENYGNYQFVSLFDIINNFLIAYVGEEKIIPKVKRTDVLYFAKQGIQEFSFDLLPQTKSIEIELSPQLYFIYPQDYVGYTKLSWTDKRGIERIIYRTNLTSNPEAYLQDGQYEYLFDVPEGDVALAQQSETLKRFKSHSDYPMEGATGNWNWYLDNPDLLYLYAYGGRYGIQPEQAQGNGVFYLDDQKGCFRFSSNLSGRIITLKYISDGLGTEEEMQVHKFAVDAIYKYIAYSILSVRANTQEYLVARFKKEMFAAKRNAKIRLSELKSDLISQVMRNQSKWIKS